MRKTGILLLNMGGPESIDEVRPFLFKLFSDRDIIKLGPSFLQKPIAWYIAKKRAPKSINFYRQIGGGSPLNKITNRQAAALEHALKNEGDFKVEFAMRYCSPRIHQSLEKLLESGVEKLLLLTLYPHYSRATTGSSLKDFDRAAKTLGMMDRGIDIQALSSWPDHPIYLKCLADNITEKLKEFDDAPVQIIYSAHSLPVSFIAAGDPYVKHIKQTVAGVEKITNKPGILCYQSRSGPVEWLSPDTSTTLKELSKKLTKNILVVPISFVSDHVETLYEIDIMFRREATEMGMRLEMTPGFNDHPKFIECLKQLVLDAS